MDYKERLERATLMAMQGLLANAAFAESDQKNLPEVSFERAKGTLDYLDSQFPNQETQEQGPKRGDVVWVRDNDDCRWNIRMLVEIKDGLVVCCLGSPFDDNREFDQPWKQMTTKNPYEVEEEVSKMETTDREPKVGDMVFAWDNENPSCVCMGILTDFGVSMHPDYKYRVDGKNWKYCSLKNPLIK